MINIFQSNQNKLDRLIYICFISLPLFLISGPLIPEIVVILISIYAIIKIIKNQKYRFFLNNKYIILFFLFWINSFIVSSLNYFDLIPVFTNNIAEIPKDIKNLKSLINSFFYFRFLFFGIGIFIILSENKELLKAFFKVCFFCFIVLFIDSYYQFFNDVNLFGDEISPDKRVSSFFGDELVLGSYSLRILILMIPILFFLEKEIKFNKIIFFIIIMIALSLIHLSGERTALLLYLLTIFLYSIYRTLSNKKTLLLLLLIIFSSGILLKFENINNRMVERTIIETNNLQVINDKFRVSFFAQQILYFATATNIFKDYPFGIGNKNFKYYCAKYRADKNRDIDITQSCSSHPHNMYFNVLVDNGIQGLVIILGLFLVILYKLFNNFINIYFKKIKINYKENLFLIGIFVNFFPLIQHGSFFNNWLSIFYYLSISFFVYFIKSK